jgi:Ca2+-binding RTX toxin-like protein
MEPGPLPDRVLFQGGSGHNLLVILGTPDGDNITVNEAAAPVTSANLPTFAGPFAVHGVGCLHLMGFAGDDVIVNNTGADSLIDGDGGNDILVGGSGNDIIFAGGGVDALFGREGKNVLLADFELVDNFVPDLAHNLEIAIAFDDPPGFGDLIVGQGEGGPNNHAAQFGIHEIVRGITGTLLDGGGIKSATTWLRAVIRPINISNPAATLSAVRNLVNDKGFAETSCDYSVPQILSAPENAGDPDPEGENPLHNYALPLDVNGDGRFNPLDVITVVSYLLSSESEGERGEARVFPDVNDDRRVNPLDLLVLVSNLLLTGSRGDSEGEGEASDSHTSVLLVGDSPAHAPVSRAEGTGLGLPSRDGLPASRLEAADAFRSFTASPRVRIERGMAAAREQIFRGLGLADILSHRRRLSESVKTRPGDWWDESLVDVLAEDQRRERP